MTLLRRCAPLDEIVVKIVAALRPEAPLPGLVDAVHRVREEADLVRSHLHDLLSSSDRLAEAAQRAYWHVNGFLKIRLAADERFCLRLHIWPPGENRRGDTEPHSHRWDFASWVAVGPGLSETYFARTGSSDPAGNAHVHYEYGRPAEHEPRLRSGGGIVWLRPDATHERPAGTVYECAHEWIHTVTPRGGDLMATVLLQGPTVTNTTGVYRPLGHKEFRDLERPVETEQLAALVADVEDALTADALV